MISNLARPAVAFSSNGLMSARDAYRQKIKNNLDIAKQASNDFLNPSSVNPNQTSLNSPIAMQGTTTNNQGNKLDIIA